jgi:hypothetical protein
MQKVGVTRKQLSGQGARGAHEEAIGLLLVAGGAPEAADIDVELKPSRLSRNRRHRCPCRR